MSEPSITLERVEGCDSQIAVHLNTGLDCPRPVWIATVDCGTGIARELTLQHMRQWMCGAAREIRRISYEAGYRDKTKKRPRRTHHTHGWQVLPWERNLAGE